MGNVNLDICVQFHFASPFCFAYAVAYINTKLKMRSLSTFMSGPAIVLYI